MGAKNKRSRAQKLNNRAHKALKNFKNQKFIQNVKDLGLSLAYFKPEKNKVQINSEEDIICDLMELIALNSIKWSQLEHRIFSVFIYSILGKNIIFNTKIMLNIYFITKKQ
jgi:hypothetical protein